MRKMAVTAKREKVIRPTAYNPLIKKGRNPRTEFLRKNLDLSLLELSQIAPEEESPKKTKKKSTSKTTEKGKINENIK